MIMCIIFSILIFLLTVVHLNRICYSILSNKSKLCIIIDIFIFILYFMLSLYILLSNIDYNNFLMLILIIFTIYNIIFTIYETRLHKSSVSSFSIKSAIDSSKDGILLLESKDSIKLINIKMNEILEYHQIKNNYINELKNKCVLENDIYIIYLENNIYTLKFTNNQVFAKDITNEYLAKKKLEESVEKLELSNQRLNILLENLEEIEESNKLFILKNKFHDILGQSLSLLSKYLNEDDVDTNKVKLIVNDLFNEINDIEDYDKRLKELIEIYKIYKIDINLTGKLPKNKNIKKVFFEVIREAITNALNHANSKFIDININSKNNHYEMIISNENLEPKNYIKENEGIKGMRKKVNDIKGNIRIENGIIFKVIVKI